MSELIKTKVSEKVDTDKYNVVEIDGVEYFRQDWMVFKMVEYAKAKLEQAKGEPLPDYELDYCEKCMQMTNHLSGVCQKCKGNGA